MPLHSVPVVIPYALDDDPEGPSFSVSVQAVGTTVQAGQAVAQVLVRALIQIRHPGARAHLVVDRIKVGGLGPAIEGPYAYVLSRGNHLNHLVLPSRIDQDRGSQLDQILSGLDEASVHGVLLDGIHLSYINSTGLGALAGHAQRLNLRAFRLSEAIQKVLEITNLSIVVPTYPDLTSALAALTRSATIARQ
jgi:anti-anti-sigma regulatory factor